MSSLQYDSLHDGIVRTFDAISRQGEAQQRLNESLSEEVARLWADNAELRDELHAVANRLENLTRAVTTSPAETAERMLRDADT